jgi:two-component system sensor histidine kinase/response regulator
MTTDKPIRVLVVDDEAVANKLVQRQLVNLGYVVAGSASDGPEAVALTCRLRPAVVLMDLQLPDPQTGQDDRLAGLQAAQAIQEKCPTPVILLTAYESSELIQRASTAGVGAYLIKPVRNNDLGRAITIALARFGDLMELRRLNADLQARNEELDAFAHTVAHDLKGPLCHIAGFALLLEEEHTAIPDEEVRQYLHTIAQSGLKMSNVIDELLLLASVGKIEEIEMGPLDMANIVAEAQRRLAYLIEEHEAEITLTSEGAWPMAMGYDPWVEEVWVNYLSNAIKYGGRPPRVELGFDVSTPRPELGTKAQPNGALERKEGTIRFWIRDNGPGLTPEEQTRLFTPFTRLDQARAKGHGLGLSIVRRIVEKMGGQFGVESEVGRGSVFSFTLPSAKDAGDG